MKIYTKTGDKGHTSLYSGKKVSKSSARIKTCGEIDELNSAIGIAIAYIHHSDSLKQLKETQFNLFTLGSEIATPPEKIFMPNGTPRLKTIISLSEIEKLEY